LTRIGLGSVCNSFRRTVGQHGTVCVELDTGRVKLVETGREVALSAYSCIVGREVEI